MVITDDCINCGACGVECPKEAILEPGESWRDNGKNFAPISNEHFYIVTEICDDCSGLKKLNVLLSARWMQLRKYRVISNQF
jgi:ferredoxin